MIPLVGIGIVNRNQRNQDSSDSSNAIEESLIPTLEESFDSSIEESK